MICHGLLISLLPTVDQLLRKTEVHIKIHRWNGARCQSGIDSNRSLQSEK